MMDDFDLMNDEWDRFCVPTIKAPDCDSSYGYDESVAREEDCDIINSSSSSSKRILHEQSIPIETDNSIAPICGDIYISTKTKIAYLNKPVVLDEVFWNIPIIPYHVPNEGVIKKQMKFNSSTKEELDNIQEKVKESAAASFVDEHVIMQIVNPSGRIQFKDVRKVSIGLCKKDIISHRCKKKSAFYNCFVVILRVKDDRGVKDDGVFREIHAKVFNTGKMEIPGIQTKEILDRVLVLITDVLRPIVLKNEEYKSELGFIEEKSETVLINSNFRCGYYINREKLYSLLKYKYKINSAYDPCSYPGIQCEFYYDPLIDKQTGRQPNDMKDRTDITKVSFMIFRTGSVLIVGKCEEDVLQEIYLFIRSMLEAEYKDTHINQQSQDIQMEKVKIAQEHNRKIKKRTIIVYTPAQSSQLI